MKHKTDPVSIRFDIEKLDFIKQKENLTSGQQVVSFLVNKYWWECKVHKPTYRDVPPLDSKENKVFDMEKPILTHGDEYPQFFIPKNNSEIQSINKKSLADYQKEIQGSLEFKDELIDLAKRIKTDENLTTIQKRDLLFLFGAK